MNTQSSNRVYRIYTGAGGYDLFSEALEKRAGFERVYVGKKVLRILRQLKKPLRKSASGRYYKLLKINLENPK